MKFHRGKKEEAAEEDKKIPKKEKRVLTKAKSCDMLTELRRKRPAEP